MIVIVIEKNMDVQDEQDLRLTPSKNAKFTNSMYQNPEPRTQNPEPRTQNPEPRTQNPEPRTQNPEPRTQKELAGA